MSTPVNLNRFRKQKARTEAKVRADQNAAFHGLSKAQRELAKAKTKQAKQLLDGKNQSSEKQRFIKFSPHSCAKHARTEVL